MKLTSKNALFYLAISDREPSMSQRSGRIQGKASLGKVPIKELKFLGNIGIKFAKGLGIH